MTSHNKKDSRWRTHRVLECELLSRLEGLCQAAGWEFLEKHGRKMTAKPIPVQSGQIVEE
jgi:hypothetical protein